MTSPGFATGRPSYWEQKLAWASHDFLAYLGFVHEHLPAVHHMIQIERFYYGGTLELHLGPPDTAKCVELHELIPLADGRRVSAEHLVGTKFRLLTMTEGGVGAVDAGASWGAVEPTYDLISESGRRVRRNGSHPFYVARPEMTTAGRMKRTELSRAARARKEPYQVVFARPPGWVRLAEVRAGDLVAVSAAFPALGTRNMPEHEVELLAYLIAEGSLTGTSKHSREKRIPDAIFELAPALQALFANRMYACDGTLGVRGAQACISFCSASEGLIGDLQELLLRLGVSSTIRRRSAHAWKLDISRAEDVLQFCVSVGRVLGKETRSALVEEFARTRTKRQVWRQSGLPVGLRWERVREVRKAGIAPTVAIHVPVYHTYLTAFFEHNSATQMALCAWTLGRNPNFRWLIASEVASGIATADVAEIGEVVSSERFQLVFGALRDPRGRQPWSSHTLYLRQYVSINEAGRAHAEPSPPPPPWLLQPETNMPPGVVPISPPRGRKPTLRHPNAKAVGWRSGYAGYRMDGLVADDLVSDRTSHSEILTQQVYDTFHQKMLARFEGGVGPSPPYGRAFVLGQRWAPRDFYGLLMDRSFVVHDSNPGNEGLGVLEGRIEDAEDE